MVGFNFLLLSLFNSNQVKKKALESAFEILIKNYNSLFHTFFYQFIEIVKFWLYYNLRSGFDAVKA